jgi:hypothetical protein
MNRPLVLSIGLLVCVAGQAEETFLDPGAMNDADRQAMVTYNSSFSACLRKQAAPLLDQHPDIREVADKASAACEQSVEPLSAHFVERGFDPAFAESVERSVKSRSLQRFLPELMAAAGRR